MNVQGPVIPRCTWYFNATTNVAVQEKLILTHIAYRTSLSKATDRRPGKGFKDRDTARIVCPDIGRAVVSLKLPTRGRHLSRVGEPHSLSQPSRWSFSDAACSYGHLSRTPL